MLITQNAHSVPAPSQTSATKVETPNTITPIELFPTPPAGDDVQVVHMSGSSGPQFIFNNTSDSGEGLVNKTLNTLHMASGGCFGKPHYLAAEDTRNGFREAIKDMTPGELDEVRDAIVNRMASDYVSNSDIKFLKDLYSDVDAKMENRPYQGKKTHLKLPTIVPSTVGTSDLATAKAIVKSDMQGVTDPIQAYRVINIHLEKANDHNEKVRELTQDIPSRLNHHPVFSNINKTLEQVEWAASDDLRTAREYDKGAYDERLYAHFAAEELKKVLENSPELTQMVNAELEAAWTQEAKRKAQDQYDIKPRNQLISEAQNAIDAARVKIEAQQKNEKAQVRTP